MDAVFARALGAEVVGTFALVFVGCGAIMVDADGGGLGDVGVALAFGLVIVAMIYALGHVSGAHFNPAVTLGFAIGRHFPPARVPAYWAAQVLGATAAAVALRISLGDVANVGATMPSGSQAQSFFWELVLTTILLLVIMAVATDTRAVGEAAAIAIGGSIAFASLVGGPVSGASLNPARSLGPAIASGDGSSLWIYLAAPLAGGVLGALVYGLMRGEEASESTATERAPRRKGADPLRCCSTPVQRGHTSSVRSDLPLTYTTKERDMIDPHLQFHTEGLKREFREVELLRPRLDRPDYGREGRLRRRLRTLVIRPARVIPDKGPLPGVTIRLARAADAVDLVRLAEISERRVPSGLVLVAEVGVDIVAALPVDGGPLLSDLRRPTGDLVQLLELRSDQLRASEPVQAA